jgi:cell division protease FtsH
VAEALLAAEDETISGSRLVQIIESTPLDDSSDIQLDNEFLPLLRELMGQVPGVVLLGEQAAQQQEEARAPPSCSTPRFSFIGAGCVGQVTTRQERGGAAAPSPRGTQDVQALAQGWLALLPTPPSDTPPSDTPPPPQLGFSRPDWQPVAPPLQLDDATLATVSRAIMGRLDVVDLVGRNTAAEVAERVRDALLDPETTERIKAVRRWAG